jgi:3-hydroxyacyl-[acyl-carrier-protein] dehydratase
VERVRAVKDYIPHREPFLFVDAIEALDSTQIVTSFTLREDLDFFRGHYPGQPIMPGVLMCEAVFQTAGIFMSALKCEEPHAETTVAGQGSTPILTKISNARFRRMAVPGDLLRITVKPVETQGSFHIMSGKVAHADGTAIMNVDFTITLK